MVLLWVLLVAAAWAVVQGAVLVLVLVQVLVQALALAVAQAVASVQASAQASAQASELVPALVLVPDAAVLLLTESAGQSAGLSVGPQRPLHEEPVPPPAVARRGRDA